MCKTPRVLATDIRELAATKNKALDLEKAMAELEKIVAQLESGDLSLEKSLQQFEKGVRLSRECQAALTQAEQKVQVLVDGEPQETSAGELGSAAN